jgi:hypothetical protein
MLAASALSGLAAGMLVAPGTAAADLGRMRVVALPVFATR